MVGSQARLEFQGGMRQRGLPLWAAAGIAILAQGLNVAHSDDQPPQPASAIGNRSTAQWRVYTNKAQELWTKGDQEGAERYMVRALEEAKRGFGDQDGHVAAALNNLAEVYRKMRQFDRAEPLYLEGLKIMEGAYGRNDQRYAMALYHIARFYHSQRRQDVARQYFRKSLQAVEASLGKAHPMYAAILTTFADLERVTDNKPQAVALYRQALEVLDALGASHSGEALVTASKLGQMLIMAGEGEEGVATLRRCVRQAEGEFPPGSPGHTSALPNHMEVLASGLQRTGDLAGSRDQLHAAIRLRTGRGPSSHQLPTAMQQCAEVELALGSKTGDRDAFVRAHNLAQQAKDLCWKGVVSGARKSERISAAKDGWRSWLSTTLGKTEEAPLPVASKPDINHLECFLKASRTAAVLLEKLDRVDEAKSWLLEGAITLQELLKWDYQVAQNKLDRKGLHSDSASTVQSLRDNVASLPRDGPLPVWLEQELLHLQMSIDFLYSWVRLQPKDDKLWQGSYLKILPLLLRLHARVPIQPHPDPSSGGRPGPSEGIVVTAAATLERLRSTRHALNDLQNAMNIRKREHGME